MTWLQYPTKQIYTPPPLKARVFCAMARVTRPVPILNVRHSPAVDLEFAKSGTSIPGNRLPDPRRAAQDDQPRSVLIIVGEQSTSNRAHHAEDDKPCTIVDLPRNPHLAALTISGAKPSITLRGSSRVVTTHDSSHRAQTGPPRQLRWADSPTWTHTGCRGGEREVVLLGNLPRARDKISPARPPIGGPSTLRSRPTPLCNLQRTVRLAGMYAL